LAENSPSLQVAVAANFINALEVRAPQFTAKCNVRIQSVFGSSGKLYAQMKNGAPVHQLAGTLPRKIAAKK